MTQSTALQPSADIDTHNTAMTNNIATQTKLGGRLNRYPAVFSADNKTLFLCAGSNVQMYSVATGETIGLLCGHQHDITSVHCNPLHKQQIYSTSTDGTIRCWDYTTAQCLAVYTCNAPILHAVLIQQTFFLNVNPKLYTDKNDIAHVAKSCRIYTFNLSKANQQHQSQAHSKNDKAAHSTAVPCVHITATAPAYTQRYSSNYCRGLSVHPTGQYVATISKNTLTVYNLKTQQTIHYTHVRHMTTVQFHSTDSYIITGDAEGQILFWYGYKQQFDTMSKLANKQHQQLATLDGRSCNVKAYHWHSHTVWCTAFSVDGAYMLSGGEEGVLVSWQLATGHKHFIPRLGSAICHIITSHDSNVYSLLMADNSICLINAITSHVQAHIHGLIHSKGPLYQPPLPPGLDKLDAVQQKQLVAVEDVNTLYTGLTWYRRDRQWLALNGLIGNIQLYDVQYDRSVNIVQVTNSKNVISRVEDKQNVVTRVVHVACNTAGDRMCTVEQRVDISYLDNSKQPHQAITNTTTLKFWSWHVNTDNDVTGNGDWLLNTTVLQPHKQHNIVDCKYHPRTNTVVTIGSDDQFKVWFEKPQMAAPNVNTIKQLQESNTNSTDAHKSTYWTCVTTGYYRDYAVHSCAWSPDGSLLAVTYGQIVTLWSYAADTQQLVLQHTIVHPLVPEPVLHVHFSPAAPYIVCHTKSQLYVWDLLTLQCVWSKRMTVAALAATDTSNVFAVVLIHKLNAGDKDTKSSDAFKTQLQVFDFSNSTPLQTYNMPKARVSQNLTTQLYTANILFVPQQHTFDALSLLYISRKRDIVRIENVLAGGELQTQSEASYSALQPVTAGTSNNVPARLRTGITAADKQQPSLITRLYGTTKSSSPTVQPVYTSSVPSTAMLQHIDSITSGPSYLLPQPDTLFDSIVSLTHKQSNNAALDTVMDGGDELMLDSPPENDTPVKPATPVTTAVTPAVQPASLSDDMLVNPFTSIDFAHLFSTKATNGTTQTADKPSPTSPRKRKSDLQMNGTTNGNDVANDESQQTQQKQLNGVKPAGERLPQTAVKRTRKVNGDAQEKTTNGTNGTTPRTRRKTRS